MTFQELVEKIREIIPEADIQTDNHGQIIIYTGLQSSEDSDVLKEVD